MSGCKMVFFWKNHATTVENKGFQFGCNVVATWLIVVAQTTQTLIYQCFNLVVKVVDQWIETEKMSSNRKTEYNHHSQHVREGAWRPFFELEIYLWTNYTISKNKTLKTQINGFIALSVFLSLLQLPLN